MCRSPTQWLVAHCDALFKEEMTPNNHFLLCFFEFLTLVVPSSRFISTSDPTVFLANKGRAVFSTEVQRIRFSCFQTFHFPLSGFPLEI